MQVGAITPQSLEHLLPCIHECLNNADWATRKAAAEALSSLALHSSSLVTDGGESTLAVLEACRFDKVVLRFPHHDKLSELLLAILFSSVICQLIALSLYEGR